MTQAAAPFSLEKWWEHLFERLPVKYTSILLGGMGAWLLWKFPAGYFRHSLGEASVIAALLIFLVDPFLKARLLKEAAKDIFHHLLGFDQQPEIKERLRRIVFDTTFFRKNFNIKYTLIPQENSMLIKVEYDFELINPTDESLEYPLVAQFEEAEKPEIDFLTLVSSDQSFQEAVKLTPKSDDACVLEGKKGPIKIQPASKGVTYRFGGKFSVTYPRDFYCVQHFGYPTIGVTVSIDAPASLEVIPSPTPTKGGNVWRYEKLFMYGDHINIRWRRRISN